MSELTKYEMLLIIFCTCLFIADMVVGYTIMLAGWNVTNANHQGNDRAK